jgi:hypothetical protein
MEAAQTAELQEHGQWSKPEKSTPAEWEWPTLLLPLKQVRSRGRNLTQICSVKPPFVDLSWMHNNRHQTNFFGWLKYCQVAAATALQTHKQ